MSIRLVVLDVDGVLTDGRLVYGPEGEEHKTFHVRDGVGVKQLLARGVAVAVVTGRGNAAVARRMAELGVTEVVTGCEDKGAAVDALVKRLGVARDEVCCVGDDTPDLAMFARAGMAVAVADAHPRVRAAATWVTRAKGGRGAVREVADLLAGAAAGFRVIVPARYGAQRLPGKPLKLIAGKPMIAHVWEKAAASGAAEVIVATEDARIVAAVEAVGGRAEMTSPDCASGTDRLAELAARHGWADDDIVVNLQGDEPLMNPEHVRIVAEALAARPAAGIATAATPVREAAELFDAAAVKVVLDDEGMAQYFSRAPIPFARGVFDGGPVDSLPPNITYLRHLGLYAYRVHVLRRVAAQPPHPTERAESLEQLRALAMGIRIHVTVVSEALGHGVDTPEDLARVERMLSKSERNG